MSRSYRHFPGLNHTSSNTKQGRLSKLLSRRRLRHSNHAYALALSPLLSKCHPSNLQDISYLNSLKPHTRSFHKALSK